MRRILRPPGTCLTRTTVRPRSKRKGRELLLRGTPHHQFRDGEFSSIRTSPSNGAQSHDRLHGHSQPLRQRDEHRLQVSDERFDNKSTRTYMIPADTICAVATRAGGALSIIRVSGTDAIRLTEKIFSPMGGKPLSKRDSNSVTFGRILDRDGSVVDEVLVSLFSARH